MLPALPDVLGRDRDRFAGKHTTVVGAGHSAANTLIALASLARDEPGTRVTWLIRNASAVRISAGDDELEGRGSLGVRLQRHVRDGRVEVIDRFEILRAEPTEAGVRLHGRRGEESATHDTDLVVAATGFRPDLGMLRELRLDLDDIVEAPRALAPLIDPNEHSCRTVRPHGYRELAHPEQGFFIVGMKSYGRVPTFLLKTGYEQFRSVVAWLAGDAESAGRVELVLSETGVCSTSSDASDGCCVALAAPRTALPLASASTGSCWAESRMDHMIRIRSMTATDWPVIERIYREGIETGEATFETEPPTGEQFDTGKLPEPRLVAIDETGQILGWAAASRVSARAVYCGVIEHSIYIAADARGRGIGRILLAAFVGAADEAGFWTIQSSIFPENIASLRLHAAAGFREVGRRERIAQSHLGPHAGQWRDTVLIERRRRD